VTFNINIPASDPDNHNPLLVSIDLGSSVIFVGANGSGKTRLAVFIEDEVGEEAHRISAHRALTLNPAVPKLRSDEAQKGLQFGYANNIIGVGHRKISRWQNAAEVALLNDFDSLIQVLFANQTAVAVETHNKCRAGEKIEAAATKFETLSDIWQRLLPHRQLVISGDDIKVQPVDASETYSASDMSDGERAIFYLVGQALAAPESSLLIIDEPELHVHPSIMSSLWDEIEAVRRDCAFLFITHDLHFAAARSAKKYVIKSYESTPSWAIEIVSDNTGFSEEITTLILGSRRPILFVEGTDRGLDSRIYRRCYPEWTVIPRGSCEEVIHAVTTMNKNDKFTHVKCAGIVDADDYTADEIQHLSKRSVFSLSVSEIENLFLLPEVSRTIVEIESCDSEELETRLSSLKNTIFEKARRDIENIAMRYCRRRIDRILKKIDLSKSKNIADLAEQYKRETSSLDIEDIAKSIKDKVEKALNDNDLSAILAIYDNKGLLADAAQHLKKTRLDNFKQWLFCIMDNKAKEPSLTQKLKEVLPRLQVP